MSRFIVIMAAALLICACESHETDHSGHDHGKSKKTTSQPSEKKTHDHSKHDHSAHDERDGKLVDYVCGMKISPSKISAEFEGKKYQFCKEACLKKFNENPKSVLTQAFAKSCVCKKEMPECDCGHCSGKLEPCDCG